MKACERIKELISGYIDHELTQQQNQMVRLHIEDCQQCRSIYQDLLAIKQSMGTIEYPECEEAKVNTILNDPTSKKLSVIGWLLVAIPLAVLFIYHIYTLFTVGGFVLLSFKTLVIMFEAGFLILLIKVIRQRVIANKTDKYNKVKL